MKYFTFFKLIYFIFAHMEVKNKGGRPKGTNKAKFGLYLDASVMADIEEIAIQDDRSINYITEKALKQFVSSYPTKGKPR